MEASEAGMLSNKTNQHHKKSRFDLGQEISGFFFGFLPAGSLVRFFLPEYLFFFVPPLLIFCNTMFNPSEPCFAPPPVCEPCLAPPPCFAPPPPPVCAPAPVVEAWGKPLYKKNWLLGKWKYAGMTDVRYVPQTGLGPAPFPGAFPGAFPGQFPGPLF